MNQDDMGQMAREDAETRAIQHHHSILFYPDYTVGPGVAPDLLTRLISQEINERSRAIPPVGTCTPP
jgi:hypothetical protein